MEGLGVQALGEAQQIRNRAINSTNSTQCSYYRNLPHKGPKNDNGEAHRTRASACFYCTASCRSTLFRDSGDSPVASSADLDSCAELEFDEIPCFSAEEESGKDDSEEEIAPEKRARSPSASLDSSSPETETRVLSRPEMIAALTPTSYEASSRWNRSVPPPGAKRIRKMTKHDDS